MVQYAGVILGRWYSEAQSPAAGKRTIESSLGILEDRAASCLEEETLFFVMLAAKIHLTLCSSLFERDISSGTVERHIWSVIWNGGLTKLA